YSPPAETASPATDITAPHPAAHPARVSPPATTPPATRTPALVGQDRRAPCPVAGQRKSAPNPRPDAPPRSRWCGWHSGSARPSRPPGPTPRAPPPLAPAAALAAAARHPAADEGARYPRRIQASLTAAR